MHRSEIIMVKSSLETKHTQRERAREAYELIRENKSNSIVNLNTTKTGTKIIHYNNKNNNWPMPTNAETVCMQFNRQMLIPVHSLCRAHHKNLNVNVMDAFLFNSFDGCLQIHTQRERHKVSASCA